MTSRYIMALEGVGSNRRQVGARIHIDQGRTQVRVYELHVEKLKLENW